jgi:hypothetical protein
MKGVMQRKDLLLLKHKQIVTGGITLEEMQFAGEQIKLWET